MYNINHQMTCSDETDGQQASLMAFLQALREPSDRLQMLKMVRLICFDAVQQGKLINY